MLKGSRSFSEIGKAIIGSRKIGTRLGIILLVVFIPYQPNA
jgi:hypothetical protein